jgi:nucleoside-diphosphate kinase
LLLTLQFKKLRVNNFVFLLNYMTILICHNGFSIVFVNLPQNYKAYRRIILNTVSETSQTVGCKNFTNKQKRIAFEGNRLITQRMSLRMKENYRKRQKTQMNIEKTFVMLKPSTVVRAIIGKAISRIEDKGLKIVAMKLTWVTQEKAATLYAVHKGKPFYDELVAFITSGPIIALVLEGDEAVKVVRKIIGATNSKEADAGTIRGDFALSNQKNAVHASDSMENAKCEMRIFFKPEEILTYNRADENWIY